MKFFGKDKQLAEEIAVGAPRVESDADIAAAEKQSPAVVDSSPDDIRAANMDDPNSLEKIHSVDTQAGVKKVEAVTLAWTKNELYVAYGCVFLVFFVVSMQQQIQNNLSVYVTSCFSLLPLTGVTSIMSSVIGGVFKLPTAKAIDLITRAEGSAFTTFIATAGTNTFQTYLLAACKNVETYAAAQVFYWTGFNGMAYVLDVFIADTSSELSSSPSPQPPTSPPPSSVPAPPNPSSRPAAGRGATESSPSSPRNHAAYPLRSVSQLE